jgi:hypothetical protein
MEGRGKIISNNHRKLTTISDLISKNSNHSELINPEMATGRRLYFL